MSTAFDDFEVELGNLSFEGLDDEDFLAEIEVPEPTAEELALVPVLVDVIWKFAYLLSGVRLYPYQEEFGRRFIESCLTNDGEELTCLFSRQCLDGNTVVFRRDGTAVRLREHEDAWSTGVKPTKRYRLRGGSEIVCTDNHPVMTDRGWVPAGLLRPGDQVSVLASWNRWGYSHNAAWARTMGYFTTDGTGGETGGRQSPKFTNTSELYLCEFSDLINKQFGLTPKRYTKGNGADLLVTVPSRRNNPFTAALRAESWDHGFPTSVMAWSPEDAAEFVNRAWAGDGCISMRGSGPEISLACGNDEVYARYWQMLLWKLGIGSTIKRERMSKGTGTFHRLVVNNGAAATRHFIKVVGLVFGKEDQSAAALEYFDEKLNRPTGKGRAEREVRPIHKVGRDGEALSLAPIVSIEDAGEREVFDVTYEDKGWFVAQGVQVHNSGKTESVADVVAALVVLLPRLAKMDEFRTLLWKYRDGVQVGTFGPTGDQADTLFERVADRLTSERAKRILADPEIDEIAKQKGDVILLKNCRSLIRRQTAHPKAKIESKTYHIIVIDEAQDADEMVVNKSIQPMGAATNATTIMLGTPRPEKGVFYKAIQRNKRAELKKGSKKLHYEFDYRYCSRYNRNYAKSVVKAKARFGEDSDEFRMAYKLEWILERGMFTTSERLTRLGDTSMRRVRNWNGSVLIGIDPARKVDSTVMTAVWVDWSNPNEAGHFHHRILDWLEMHGEDWENQYFRMVEFISRYPNTMAVGVDEGGMGDNVISRLRTLLPQHIDVVACGSSPKEQSKRWKHLAELLTGSHPEYGALLQYPAHPEARRTKTWQRFFLQMTELEKKYQGAYLLAEAPEERGAHDDFCDSLGFACVLSLDATMPEVQTSENPFHGREPRGGQNSILSGR